ncbi:MAG: hypothetical protein EP306_02220, partial [Burkholderiales bacterium]
MPWRRRSLLMFAGAPGLSACSFNPDRDHQGAEAPRAEPLRRPVRVAWVLSSGGPRGFVHVGVLQALEALQLRPDLIVGASAGALVGSLFASGVPAGQIAPLALDLQPFTLGRVAMGALQRWRAGRGGARASAGALAGAHAGGHGVRGTTPQRRRAGR